MSQYTPPPKRRGLTPWCFSRQDGGDVGRAVGRRGLGLGGGGVALGVVGVGPGGVGLGGGGVVGGVGGLAARGAVAGDLTLAASAWPQLDLILVGTFLGTLIEGLSDLPLSASGTPRGRSPFPSAELSAMAKGGCRKTNCKEGSRRRV